MKFKISVFVLMALTLGGCVTPPVVKQAIVAQDSAYSDNLKLMQQYQHLLQQIETRRRLWYVYIESRKTLNLAIEWITSDPTSANPNVDDKIYVDTVADILGPDLMAEVNRNRFGGLKARAGSAPTPTTAPTAPATQSNGFVGGNAKNDMNTLIPLIPKLVRLSQAQASKELPPLPPAGDFDVYAKNVGALKQINAVVKTYLDIDVTVSSQDVKSIADAIKNLK